MKKNAFIKVLAVLGIAVLGLTGGHTGGNGFAEHQNEKGNGIVTVESGGSVGTGLIAYIGHRQEEIVCNSKDRGGFSDGQERNGLEKDSGDRAGNGLHDGKEGGNGFGSTGGGNG